MQGEVYCCSASLKRTKAAYFSTASSFLAPSNTLIVSNWQQLCDEVTQSSVFSAALPTWALTPKLLCYLLFLLFSHLPIITPQLCLRVRQELARCGFFEEPGERCHYSCFRGSVTHDASQELRFLWDLVRRAGLQWVWMTWRLCSWDLTCPSLFRSQKIHQPYAHSHQKLAQHLQTFHKQTLICSILSDSFKDAANNELIPESANKI